MIDNKNTNFKTDLNIVYYAFGTNKCFFNDNKKLNAF